MWVGQGSSNPRNPYAWVDDRFKIQDANILNKNQEKKGPLKGLACEFTLSWRKTWAERALLSPPHSCLSDTTSV